MNKFLIEVEKRRSIYDINDNISISDDQIEQIIAGALRHTPSAFNMQSGRIVLLLKKEHEKLWDIVLETLRKRVPSDKFASTEKKIAGFASGYGTVLFFEDQDTVTRFAEESPNYAENFQTWSQQGGGMLQYVVWAALEAEGLGANIQHYNPIIDEEVASTWNIPKSWKMTGQMPFGGVGSQAGEKAFLPLDLRFKSYK